MKKDKGHPATVAAKQLEDAKIDQYIDSAQQILNDCVGKTVAKAYWNDVSDYGFFWAVEFTDGTEICFNLRPDCMQMRREGQ